MPSAWTEPGVWAFTGRQGNLSLNVVTLDEAETPEMTHTLT